MSPPAPVAPWCTGAGPFPAASETVSFRAGSDHRDVVVAHFNHEFMTQRHPGGGALGAPATGTAGRIAGEPSARQNF